MANMLSCTRIGAIGFIEWLDDGMISSRTASVKIPFPVRDFNACDFSWIKRDLRVPAHLGNNGVMSDRNIFDDASIR